VPVDSQPRRSEAIAAEIDRFLMPGDSDLGSAAWPGNVFERARYAADDLRVALVAEVYRRSDGRAARSTELPSDLVMFTRRKVEPMVRGLFARSEQEAVLSVVERSVVFLTAGNIEQVLLDADWHHTAWDLANLYLASLGAELLGESAVPIVGLSEGTSCFVSPAYFDDADPFADFEVHEVAHIFHNCKRRTIGLSERKTQEWLLEVEYRKRETFAYACEAFSRICERAPAMRNRGALAALYTEKPGITDERVDPAEVADIVTHACQSRNGWKIILARCARPKPRRANHDGRSGRSEGSAPR
jgi:hypothetical protein